MNKQLALVTGGIGGLGTEICRQLAKSGKRVIAADLGSRSDRVSEFLDEVSEFSDDISFEPLDVSSFEECTTSLKAITDKHGPISILVNAAGITRDTSLRKMSERQWSDVITVNLDGVFNTCRALVDGMTERGFGRIGQTNYSAAKAGMHGFTMALAREVARKGVTVNSVSPGYCETALVMAVPQAVREQIVANIPVGRLGKPKEIARVVDFLCADDSGFITGANIPVNGGYFMDF